MKQFELDAYKNHLKKLETPNKFHGSGLTEKKELEPMRKLKFGYEHRDQYNTSIGYK